MPEDPPAIARLPLDTQSRLRSTQILTSLVQIVSELLQNSLDAEASRIDVGLDCKEWMCWVRDDGHGIAKDGLERLAQDHSTDAGRYNSSKTYAQGTLHSPSSFGFRGEALASAADISCLEICSRTPRSPNTWSIILKGGQTLYIGPAVRWQRESSGTTVCVRDAFYNLPVRRLSHVSPSRTWDLVRREIETYALMFPNVAFTLEDSGKSSESSCHKGQSFRIPKCASTVDVFRRLYGHTFTEHIHIVSEESATIKIEGFISLTGAYSKIYQFLYINRHPILLSDLGREIDSQFNASSFGKNALDEEGDSSLPRSTMRRSPRKSEKKPVYVLNISLAPEEVDNCLDPSKSSVHLRNQTNVIALLSSVIQSFLKRNGFSNQDQLTTGRSVTSSPSPRKRKKFHPDHSEYREHDSLDELSTLSLEGDHNEKLHGGHLHEHPREAHPPEQVDVYASLGCSSAEILWTDPSTGRHFTVDSRTGNSFPQSTNNVRRHGGNGIIDTRREERRTLSKSKTGSLAKRSLRSPNFVPDWLEKALESNRAYEASESRIPVVKGPPSAANHITPGHPFQFNEQSHSYQLNRSESYVLHPDRVELGKLHMRYETSMHRFTKDDLRHAEVISQVDRKFIACRLVRQSTTGCAVVPNEQGSQRFSANSDSTLVLIDQHAADERVRVERYLKELCQGFLCSQERKAAKQAGTRITELNPPQPVLLTQHEAHSINGSQDAQEILRKWGIGFAELCMDTPVSASESGCSNGYSQLLVSCIPEVVSDKLLQGNELRDFIKGILGQIQSGELFSDARITLPPVSDQDQFVWLKAVRHCPKVLLDLINSKACRGAIMFNDTLSMSQCERLVKQLAETAFPFQCAHGRPSLVPLIEIGAAQADLCRKRNRPGIDWAGFRR